MKKILRQQWRALRDNISPSRRKSASRALLEAFYSGFTTGANILSYASYNSELSTLELNQFLAKNNSLLLPKVEEDHLIIYKVKNLDKELERTKWGVMEPIPSLCEEVDPSTLILALVPGLAFDSQQHRLGYGHGHFDRFLFQHCKARANCVGVAFREQFSSILLPIEGHDIAMTKVIYL